MRVVNWKRDLGDPQTPGRFYVDQVGSVRIKQNDIDRAKQLGGSPDVELIEEPGMGDAKYLVGLFLPS